MLGVEAGVLAGLLGPPHAVMREAVHALARRLAHLLHRVIVSSFSGRGRFVVPGQSLSSYLVHVHVHVEAELNTSRSLLALTLSTPKCWQGQPPSPRSPLAAAAFSEDCGQLRGCVHRVLLVKARPVLDLIQLLLRFVWVSH